MTRRLSPAAALVLLLGAGCSVPHAAPSPADVTGRIAVIAAVDEPDRPHNMALASRTSSTGTWSLAPLWVADSEISDWLPSPDGRRTVYREVWHYVPKTEALVVRNLTASASPRYAVMGEPELSRLAGHAWSPDGLSIAYGVQAGDVAAFSGAGGTRRWEMRAVDVGAASDGADDRRLFALDGASLGTDVYTLLAWSPDASRAALLETPGGGGTGSSAVRIHDTTDGHLVRRVAPGGDDPVLAASPDGRRVAWLSATAGVGTIDVESGDWRAIEAVASGMAPVALAWSHDGRWLGWAMAADRGEASTGGTRIEVNVVRVDGWRWTKAARRASFAIDAADGGLGLLALSPGGDAALWTDVLQGGRAVARVARLERRREGQVMDVAGTTELSLPSGVWGVGWWP